MTTRIKLLATAGVAVTAFWPAAASAPAAGPTVERSTLTETYADDFALEVCGVKTMTTLTQRLVIKTYADGTEIVHVNARYVPADRRVATEQLSRTEIYAPDGTLTIKGLAIRLSRKGEGTIIRDAGWIHFYEDGILMRGPHDFYGTDDPADFYC
jgi:hypothetical protein